MSGPSAPPEDASATPFCPNERAHGRMRPAIVQLHFPAGKLPAKGMRCDACGEESLWGAQLAEAQGTAERLGLYGPQRVGSRRLHRSGTSIVVSLDPVLLQEALGGATAGDEVEVGRQGDAIVIRRAKG
jgi:hypothetical protein